MNLTIRTRVFVSSWVSIFLLLIFFSGQTSAFANSRINELSFEKWNAGNYLSSELSANLSSGSSHENDEAATETSINGHVDNDEATESQSSNESLEAICPPPIINTQPQSVTTCLGSSVTFSVVANTNGPGTIVYQWKKGAANISGATGSNLIITSVTSASAGSYTVAVTKSCGATVTSVAAVLTVNNVDGGSINGTQTICVGVSAAAITNVTNGSGAGALSYQWEESPDLSSWSPIGGATDVTYSPGILNSTKHFRRMIASLLNGITCNAYSNTVSITVTQVTASASSNSPICEGSLLSLQATGGASYSWSGPNGFSDTQQNPGISNVSLSASGTYSVTVTNSSGCSATVTAAVTINPKPTPTASNNSPLCEGASLSLSSCGGTSFLWSGPQGFNSNNKNTSMSEVSQNNAGLYTVTVENSYGCTAVTTTTVIVNPNPTVTASNSGPICEGGSLDLTSSSADSYTWTGPDGFTSTNQNPSISNVTPSANGRYEITVTNAFGCTALATTDVEIYQAPNVSISSTDVVNVGGVLSLSANGGLSYSWTGPNGFTSTVQNPIIQHATLAASGTYYVAVTNSAGCVGSASVAISIIQAQVNEISSNSPLDEGSSLSLRSGGGGESYYWEGPNGFTSTEENPTITNADESASGTYTVTITDENGNTSVSTTDVIIYPMPTASANNPVCEGGLLNLSATGGVSYAWVGPNGFTSSEQNPMVSGATLDMAGAYTVTVTRGNGSTKTATTTLTVNPSYSVTLDPATSCDEYLLPWGQTASTSGVYSHTYSTINGCDSTVTINVNVNSSFHVTGASVSDCNSHTLPWGIVANSTGDYSHVYSASNGCDSTVTIHVNINPTYSIWLPAAAACESYSLPWGDVATASGDYSYTYSSMSACDSTVNVHVTINHKYETNGTEVTACDSYTLPWGDVATTSGNYSHIYSSISGCDSTVNIPVTINQSYNVVADPVIACNSHTFAWGSVVTTSGNYSHVYQTSGGCDSTVTVQVTVHQSYNIVGSAVNACGSYTLPWGEVATTTDNYDYTYSSKGGCDSTVTIHVTINNAAASSFNASACGSYTLPWGGSVNASGNYAHTYSTVNGCDSVVTAHVTINNAAASSFNVVACGNYTLPWGGSVNASGNYAHTYSTVNGCDSVVTAHVTINNAAASSFNASACGSYSLPWGGSVNASGNYAHTYSTVNGCDSVVTAHVTINNAAASSFNASACGSYTLPWGGSVNASGNYAHTYSTVNGCDSVVTAHVTINNAAASSFNASACGSYSLPWGGSVNTSGNYAHTYSTVNGCDSVVTAHVTINNAAASSFNASACGSYTLPWGGSVNASGNYAHTYSTVNGCDSVVTAHVTINNAAASSFNASACGSYSLPWGGSVNASGNYAHTYSTVNGCDSVVTAHVTINGYPTASASSGSACTGGTLNLASSGGATYSWVGPNGFTSSSQNPSISNATTAGSGTYTVTVSNGSGCSATATTTVTVSTASATASSTPACTGKTLTLSASSGNSYAWTGPNGFTSTLQSPTIANVTTAANGTYNVAVTNASGCVASASTTVTVSTAPTATTSGNTPVVGGSTLNLTSSGGVSYSWVGPNSFTSAVQNPSIASVTWQAAGTYTVTVTNAAGCTATATTSVTVNCAGFKSYTYTQGGWGAAPAGNNPAVYRNANFPYAFPSGITVGYGTKWLNLTTSQAVQDFLPSGGSPSALSTSYTNPGGSLSNTLAGQVVALACNIGFDNYDASFAPNTPLKLKDLFVKSGTFKGWTVQQVFDESSKKLGGGTSSYSASELNTACTSINQNYDNGTTDAGFLSCIPVRVENPPTAESESNLKIYPNPNNGQFVLDLDLKDDNTTQVDIQILNMLGQSVYRDRTAAVDGKLREEVKFENNLTGGNYMVRVNAGDKIFSQQIIYQK